MQENFSIEGRRIHDFLDGNGPVPAHRHPNGGGWVAETATVANTVYVGKQARVFGNAIAKDHVQIKDQAEVSGQAIIGGKARICGRSKVQGHAIVEDEILLRDDVFIATNLHLKGCAVFDDHLTLVNEKSCLRCPFMPRDTYGVTGDNPCVACQRGIVRRKR